MLAGNSIYRAIYLKSPLIPFLLNLTIVALNNFNLKSFLALGLTEKLIYRFMVNLKPSLVGLGIIENLNTLLSSFALGLIAYNTVLSAIVNLKSPVKDIGMGI